MAATERNLTREQVEDELCAHIGVHAEALQLILVGVLEGRLGHDGGAVNRRIAIVGCAELLGRLLVTDVMSSRESLLAATQILDALRESVAAAADGAVVVATSGTRH